MEVLLLLLSDFFSLAFFSWSPQVKETEELTNLCDELIAKVQKG